MSATLECPRRVCPPAESAPLAAGSPRRRLQGRARAAVLGALALFAVGQVILSGGIEAVRPELRDPTFEIKYRQLATLLARQPQPRQLVVFLGSSMTGFGVKADTVDGLAAKTAGRPVLGYNLGVNLAGPFTQLIYAQRLLRRGVRPDLVVIEVSPLVYQTGPRDLERFPAHVLEYDDMETVARHAGAAGLQTEWWETHLVPVHGHRLMMLNQLAPILVPYDDRVELWRDADDHGWRPLLPPDSARHQQSLALWEKYYRPKLAHYQISDEALAALEDLLNLLRREDIPFLLMAPPNGPMMRSLFPTGPVGALMAEFRSRCQQHGGAWIDASDWCAELDFADSHHLHRDGAVKFTDRLIRQGVFPALDKSR